MLNSITQNYFLLLLIYFSLYSVKKFEELKKIFKVASDAN